MIELTIVVMIRVFVWKSIKQELAFLPIVILQRYKRSVSQFDDVGTEFLTIPLMPFLKIVYPPKSGSTRTCRDARYSMRAG
jgi:hypothetical protein